MILAGMWTAPAASPRGLPALRRIALMLALMLGCAACGSGVHPRPVVGVGGLRVVREQRLGPRLQEWTLRTGALRGDTRVRVLLPAAYGRDARRRYPVLYLL